MSSFLRTVGRRKKTRLLGEADVLSQEDYAALELDARVDLVRALIPLGMMHVEELLLEEVEALAGGRYERKQGETAGVRYGSNKGSVRLGGRRVPVNVPRVRSERGEISLRSYASLKKGPGQVDELLLKRVLYGISCRNYEAASESVPGSIGLSSSSVSRAVVEASAAKLREFQERDLSGQHYVAIFLDGKTFADTTMVVALGVRITGEKEFLGFVETDTENSAVLTPFLRSLLSRGLDISRGILAIVDGGKGLRKALRKAFKRRCLVQRCQWHKRENVVKYLPRGEQKSWRRRLQKAYDRPNEKEAESALREIHRDLEELNQSAAASLAEGLAETLTLHRLGVFGSTGRSFKTTNCIESSNALVEERCAKVDRWRDSNQKHRWLAAALLDIEPRMRRVKGFRNLPQLQEAISRTLGLDQEVMLKEAA